MTRKTLPLTSAVMSRPSASRHTRQCGVAQEIPHLGLNKLHLEQVAVLPYPSMQHIPELLNPYMTMLLPGYELAFMQYCGMQIHGLAQISAIPIQALGSPVLSSATQTHLQLQPKGVNSLCEEHKWVFNRKGKDLQLQGHKRFSFRVAVSEQQEVTLLPIICSSVLVPNASQQQGSVRCGLQFPIHNSQFIYFPLGATSAPKLVTLCNMSTQEHEDARGNGEQGACKRVEDKAHSSIPTGRRKGCSVTSRLQLHRAKLILLYSICTVLRAVQSQALNSIRIQLIFLSHSSVLSLVCGPDVHC